GSIGRYSFWYIYWLITDAHILGAVIAYGIGFWLREFTEHVFGQGKGFKKARAKLLDWYGHYGSVIVFAARLVGYVRPWSSLIAGFAEFAFWPFLLWSSLGTLIFVYVTMKVTAVLVIAWQHFPFGHIIISLLIALGFFAFLFFARRKSKSAS
ncbi:MAG TPA: VTT domain-containing protein, partial [Candidatus Saccharimonadales bacterium]|nr:VTT domain-containing protein [Candidatus Saccharimonadales bacterium]